MTHTLSRHRIKINSNMLSLNLAGQQKRLVPSLFASTVFPTLLPIDWLLAKSHRRNQSNCHDFDFSWYDDDFFDACHKVYISPSWY